MIEMTSYGIFEPSEQKELEDIKNDISSEIKLSLENISKAKTNIKYLQTAIEKIIRTCFVDTRGKKPVVFVGGGLVSSKADKTLYEFVK